MARIGVDLDGVAYPFTEEIRAYISGVLNAELPQFTHWNTHQKQWGLTNEQLQSLMTDALSRGMLWASGKPEIGFTDALWKLSDAGHTIVIATDRFQSHTDKRIARLAASTTRAWLRAIGANYDELLFTADKRDAGCDFFVDDRPQAIPLLRLAGVDAVYFDRPWNRQLPYQRVHSWEEFVTYVEERCSVQAG